MSAISQEKRDKTEVENYEYNISSFGKRVTAGMNGNKRFEAKFGAKCSSFRQSSVGYSLLTLS